MDELNEIFYEYMRTSCSSSFLISKIHFSGKLSKNSFPLWKKLEEYMCSRLNTYYTLMGYIFLKISDENQNLNCHLETKFYR